MDDVQIKEKDDAIRLEKLNELNIKATGKAIIKEKSDLEKIIQKVASKR